MSTRPTPRTRLAGAFVALVAAGSLAVPAVADAAATSEDPATTSDDVEVRPRLELACRRIPNLQLRIDRLLERLGGDAEPRGSLAWLEAQIDRADGAGREQLAVVLENRLAVREALVPVLELRSEALDDLAGFCRELGVDL